MIDKIRVIIADDHTIVRSGIRLLLSAEEDIEVVGEALNGIEVLELVEKLKPDLVLMDISMPVMDGLQATRLLKERFPEIQVLILTMHRSDEYFFEVLKAGASGYILKGASANDLLDAVRQIKQGDVYMNSTMVKKLVQGYLQLTEWDTPQGPVLSQRERDILQLLAEGYSNKEISEKLVISPSTVHTHRNNLMHKLGFSSPRELIVFARKHGLIQ